MSKLPVEQPLSFRTKELQWNFYPNSGRVCVHGLKISKDGSRVEVGNLRFQLSREQLRARPDILSTLITYLEAWRG